jgi:hypothetical protein
VKRTEAAAMNDVERSKLIRELEMKSDHDVLILAAADVAELKDSFKTVCADVQDHSTRLTVIETNWKMFAAIIGALVIIVPVVVDLLLKVA